MIPSLSSKGRPVAWASVRECPRAEPGLHGCLVGFWWSASAVEDVDLGDFGQSIVEPVVDQKAAAEVPDKTTTLRFALPKRFSTLFRGSPNEMPAIESPATISRFFGCVELDGESPWLTALAAWCDEEQPTSAAGAKSSTHNAATEATRRVIARECRPWRS